MARRSDATAVVENAHEDPHLKNFYFHFHFFFSNRKSIKIPFIFYRSFVIVHFEIDNNFIHWLNLNVVVLKLWAFISWLIFCFLFFLFLLNEYSLS